MKKVHFLLVILLLIPIGGLSGNEPDPVIAIALCRPEEGQIKNIEVLYEKDLITVERLRLLCIYHEDEKTDYAPARRYVKEEGLEWVTFLVITGQVPLREVYRENHWTPQFRKIFESTRGIIFTGGMDLPPALYREPTHLLSEVHTPIRSVYETSFLFHLVGGKQDARLVPFLESKRDYAVLGLCLGCQTLNVAAGGTLYQDIPTEIYHLTYHQEVLNLGPDRIHSARYVKALHPLKKDLAPAFHRIEFAPDSLFVKEWGFAPDDHPSILTSHHQAVKDLGKDLCIVARSMDGRVIEAIHHTRYPGVLGVQFHPEYHSLFMKGKLYRQDPAGEKNFNLRRFLLDHPPSMDFHVRLWEWFSRSIER